MKNREMQNFEDAMKRVLSVSHEERQRREEEWKRENADRPKRGPKPRAGKGEKQPYRHRTRAG